MRRCRWGTLLGEDSAPVHDMRNFCTPGSDCPKELSNPHGEVYDLNKVSVAVRRYALSFVDAPSPPS
jgi:hypothetical protein